VQRLVSIVVLVLVVGAGWKFLQDGSPGGSGSDRGSPLAALAPGPKRIAGGDSAPMARAGRPTVRIASFNIQVFGRAKEQNVAAMQTLAAIIQNFDVVAIQEIRIKDDFLLQRFLSTYLNPVSGKSYDYVLGPRLGRSNSKEQYAFIYDTNRIEVDRNHTYTVRDPDDLLHREPFVAMFRVRGPPPGEAFTFVLVNVHTDPDEVKTELDDLAKVCRAVRVTALSEDDVILLGDFNVDSQHMGELGKIPGLRPLIMEVFTNTRQTALYDNVLIHHPSTAEFVGRAGVYDFLRLHNLTLSEALQVSDHMPVWAEFSIYESAKPGRVALNPAGVTDQK
jgi:deoxyribonuclease-1-like protein